jgi:hypothetical protein
MGEKEKTRKKLAEGVLEGGMACIGDWLDSYAAFLAKYKNFPSKSLFLKGEELILELRKAFPLILPGRQHTKVEKLLVSFSRGPRHQFPNAHGGTTATTGSFRPPFSVDGKGSVRGT